MLVGVVYEEEYTLYDQKYSRNIEGVVVQRPNETEEEFNVRLTEYERGLTSRHSWYESEVVYAE